MGPVDFNYFLDRKYATLEQQADAATTNANANTVSAAASTVNAAANTRNAATNALTGGAAANLDRVRAQLLPTESAATVANLNARTGETIETTKYIGPLARANIANTRASARNLNASAFEQESDTRDLNSFAVPGGASMRAVMGAQYKLRGLGN